MTSKQKPKRKCGLLSKKKLPIRVSQHDFNRYIKPFLRHPKKGPKPKCSSFKIFNHILYVLHTGIQWKQLPVSRSEIHWSNIYKWHNRWSKDGSYRKLFESSVLILDRKGMLDLSVLHGDGTNVVAKKGAGTSGTRDTNTRRERRRWR